MITNCKVNLRLFDVTAVADATPSTSDKQAFINLNDFKSEFNPEKFVSGEKNQWITDGTFLLFPDAPNNHKFGLWSQSVSDDNGNFATPPVLDITFGSVHSSIGLTFYFYDITDDWAKEIEITWYGASGTVLSTKTYKPDKGIYFASNTVQSYKRITVKFKSTNKPNRYLKLARIGYGVDFLWSGEQIEDASIIEEIDPISEAISTNVFDVKIVLPDEETVKNIHATTQQQQQLIVIEAKNGTDYAMGTFYINKGRDTSENVLTFNSSDLTYLLDKTEFMGGMYVNQNSKALIDQIMAKAGTTLYTVSTDLSTATVTGYLPICNCREALQKICFAINAVVDCSRSDKINIHKQAATPVLNIPLSQKFVGDTITDDDIVTSVELTLHKYTQIAETTEAFNGTLSGNALIKFSEPLYGLTISGGTIVNSGTNYANISGTGGVVILTGKRYTDSSYIISKAKPNVPSAIQPKVARYENTLIWNEIENLNNLYNYNLLTVKNNVKILLENAEKVGNNLLIDSRYNRKINGKVIKNNIDLTGGFVGSVDVIGEYI